MEDILKLLLVCILCVCRCELDSVNNTGSNGRISPQKTQHESTAPLLDSTKSPSILLGRHKIQPPVLPYLSSVFQDLTLALPQLMRLQSFILACMPVASLSAMIG